MVIRSYFLTGGIFELLFFLFILLILSSYSYAQNPNREEGLSEFLKTIESRFEVKFSYADDQIENFIAAPHSSLNSLQDHLKFLEVFSPFSYDKHSNKNILIIPNDNEFELCVIVKDELTQTQLTEASLKASNFLYKPNASGQFKIFVNTKEIELRIRMNCYTPELKRVVPSQKTNCIKVMVSPFYMVLDEIILTDYLTGGIQKY